MNAPSLALQRFVGTPTVSAAPRHPAEPSVTDHADATLASALRQINALPVEQRLAAVFDALTAHFDQKAVTSLSPSAIPCASGFRTIQRSIKEVRDISVETAQSLGAFLGAWFLALVEEGIAMNAPTISHDRESGHTSMRLSWRRDDRTFEVSMLGSAVTFSATSFTEDRRLDYQEGSLDLSLPVMRRTVGWLAGFETH